MIGKASSSSLLAVMALVMLPGGAAFAQKESVYDRILKSTVWIVIRHNDKAVGGRIPISMGTGTLIDSQKRIVLTNYHVVTEASDIICFFPAYKDKKIIPERKHYVDMINNGGGIKAQTLAREKKVDLALIQLATVPEGARVMPLAKDAVAPGQTVHSVGNPGASQALWVYTPGRVRQIYQKQFKAGNESSSELLDIDARVVETDSPTNPGDSGGPLVNEKCELVGVTQGGARNAASISTFIEVTEVKTLLAKAKIRPVIASGAPEPREPSKPPAEKLPAKTLTPDEQNEKRAERQLVFAKDFVTEGNKTSACECCEEILKKWPKTKAAAEAKEMLDKLKKK